MRDARREKWKYGVRTDTLAVFNPASAGGRTGKRIARWTNVLHDAFPSIEIRPTEWPEHATQIVRDALIRGTKTIIGVGGDGTVSECVNGFFDGATNRAPDAAFGFIMSGTGGDIRRTYNIPEQFEGQLDVLRQRRLRSIDIGHVHYVDHSGSEAERVFMNTLSFGMSGKVCTAVKEGLIGRIGGKTSFYLAALKGALGHRNQKVHLKFNGREEEHCVNTVAVGNGRYFGGKMMIAPEAIPDDGEFDLVIVGDLNRWEVFTSMSLLYQGTHIEHSKVTTDRLAALEAESDETVLIECDGEGPGRLPLKIRLLPKALNLIVP